MAWGSTAPAAIAGLVATLQTVDAAVLDSSVVSDSGTKEAVNVGWQTEDQDSIEMAFDPATTVADLETVTINNAVRVLRGRDMPAARARVFALFGQVGTRIKADSTLGGAVMRAWVSSGSLQIASNQRGAQATILFAVTYEAYTTE